MSSYRQIIYFSTGIIAGSIVTYLIVQSFNNQRQDKNDKVASFEQNVSTDINEDQITDPVVTDHKVEKTSYKSTPDSTLDFFPHIDQDSYLYDSLRMAMQIVDEKENIITDEPELIFNEPVKKEQLLKIGQIPFYDRTETDLPNKSDSLLSKNNGIKLEKQGLNYEVEFWQSPLNTKGYRMGKNKIAVWGLVPESLVAVYQLEAGLFLKTNNAVFKLEKSPQFRNFVKENNQEILKQLN